MGFAEEERHGDNKFHLGKKKPGEPGFLRIAASSAQLAGASAGIAAFGGAASAVGSGTGLSDNVCR